MSSGSSSVANPTATGPAAGPTDPTTTATTSPGGLPGAATADALTPTPEVGNLTYPGNVSALYTVPASGLVTATATWSGAADLSLSIACPGRQTQQTGPTGLSVSVAGTTPEGGSTGTCAVTIAEPTGTEATVSYSLSVRYSPS